MATEDDSKSVILISQESESFEVPLSIAMMSEMVKQIIDIDALNEDEKQEIPLPNVKSSILAKVIEFTQHYKTEPMTEIEKVSSYNHEWNDFSHYFFLNTATQISQSE